MPILFPSAPGYAKELPRSGQTGTFTQVDVSGAGGAIRFLTHKTIVTKIGIGKAVNVQFMHTIGDAIHTYVFGDKMGQLRVHCLSFDASCNGGADHGLVLADQWYEDNKLSATDTPVTAMIGRKVFSGLLLGSETEYADAENKMAQIVLNFALLEG